MIKYVILFFFRTQIKVFKYINPNLMSKREATFSKEILRNVRHRPNPPPETYDERVLRILKDHPCRDNVRDNKCNATNPFGFRYFSNRVDDVNECMDFSKPFFTVEIMNPNYRSLRNRYYLVDDDNKKLCTKNRLSSWSIENHHHQPLALERNNQFLALQNERKRIQRESLPNLLPQLNNIIADYLSHNNEDEIYKLP